MYYIIVYGFRGHDILFSVINIASTDLVPYRSVRLYCLCCGQARLIYIYI